MALLNVKEVSEWLQVKPSTIYLWAAEGKMPALKIHGVIRFRREDIEAWLAGCQLEPPTPSRPADRRRTVRRRRYPHCDRQSRGLYFVPRETRPRQGHTKGGHPWLCIGEDQSGGCGLVIRDGRFVGRQT